MLFSPNIACYNTVTVTKHYGYIEGFNRQDGKGES